MNALGSDILALLRELLAELRDMNRKQPKISYTVPEAAAITGRSESELRRMIADDDLHKVPHLGRSVIIPHTELVRRFGTIDTDSTVDDDGDATRAETPGVASGPDLPTGSDATGDDCPPLGVPRPEGTP